MPIPKAIHVALVAYQMTISHPLIEKPSSKVAAEQALQCIQQLVMRGYVSGRAGGPDDQTGSGAVAVSNRNLISTRNLNQKITAETGEPSQLHQLLEALHYCSIKAHAQKMPTVLSHVAQCTKAIMTSPRCGIHNSSMLFGIKIAFHSFLVIQDAPSRKSIKEALMDIVEYYVQRLERCNETPAKNPWYADCFNMLRSFVKLSSKDIEGVNETTSTVTVQKPSFFWESSTVDLVALNNKILSLELQRQALECAGPVFCNGEKFIQLVQSQNGSIALFKNCMSQCSQVAYVSQQLFIILAYKFKNHIKDEIGAFMTNVFFRVVGSDNSSFTQKAVALESLRSLCNDPFLLSQLFLNYDCDFDSMNLYKDVVFHLSQLCAKSSIASFEPAGRSKQKGAEENAELSLAGSEIIVTILQAFLKALDIPMDDTDEIDTAGKKIRKDLHLEETNGTTASGEESLQNSLRSNYGSMGSLSFLENGSQSRMDSEDLTGTILGFFEKKRCAEQNLELGVVKFTMDLKKGLKFFIENGFVTCDAQEIAQFFLAHKDRLDKTQIGEVLGREPDAAFIKGKPDLDPEKGGPGFFLRILHHYAMALDFTDMFFAEAMRLFLSGFRLPGEAQKIDRIMEKFAERYTIKNPDVFPSADTAFILAFSVIMLNTDLHNPSIKPERRMTIESFIRNNRGINNGADLDPEFLTSIFKRIKEKPFSLKEDDAAREKAAGEATQILGDNGGLLGGGFIGGVTAEERKKEKFEKEREDMLTATELLIRRKKGRSARTEHLTDDVDPAMVVKPMFDVTWGAIIGSLSQVMEISNDDRAIAVCLKGFVYAIRISAHSNMSLSRDTFLGSLAKSSYLGSIKELKDKNIEVMRTLINIAITDGEYLGESWGPVLQCISQIARMQMSASGLDNDETFLQDNNSTHSGPSDVKKEAAPNRRMDLLKETENANSVRVLNAFGEQFIDQVFSSSVKLSAESLALFIEQLIAVANSEIEGESKKGITGVSTSTAGSNNGESGPSIFSMQRLVEVADYNMHIRPRLVWARIWGLMADFFTKNGSHSNPMVSVFAVDALKQLSLKFLEKPEAPEFHFQKLFLEPFLLVMKSKDTRQETREVILACVDQMINSRVDNIRSGWKVFFGILQVGAKDPNNGVSRHALTILQGTLDKHLDRLGIFAKEEDPQGNRNSNAQDFLAMCKASLSFLDRNESGPSQPVSVCMRALCHVAIYADLIGSNRVLPPTSGSQSGNPSASGYSYEGLDEQETLEMVLWRPLIEGLANGIRATTRSTEGGIGNLLQSGSVLTLRAILLRHKASFSCNQLQAILTDTIIPAFQTAVENDKSSIRSIASDSPSISSLDFLADPLPIPPGSDDSDLLKFASVVQQSDRNPRPMGPAELLLEATFTVMRNGGDNLSEAYKFAKKVCSCFLRLSIQPFPDSWISTTASIALGTLTDISTEILLLRGREGATVWRSTVAEIYQNWCNGDITKWVPCEAVVRIATAEFERCITRAVENLSQLADKMNAKVWANNLVEFYAEMMAKNLGLEQIMMELLLEEKCRALDANSKSPPTDLKTDVQSATPQSSKTLEKHEEESGNNGRTELKNNTTGDIASAKALTSVGASPTDFERGKIQGPIFERSELLPAETFAKLDEKFLDRDSPKWMKYLPGLKLRCVAAHCLQKVLLSLREEQLIGFISQQAISNVLKILNSSRAFAEAAVKNENLAHAFQDAMFSEWGISDDLGEDALENVARLNNTQGSAMFFLTQTASATNGVIRLLSDLYDHEETADGEYEWDRRMFAGQCLLTIKQDIFRKFTDSEAKEGHKVDPNVWRNTTESGVKVAIYCTSFASVVVGLLKAMLSFEPALIERNKADIFPLVCELVGVRSEEIRKLVRRVLTEKFGPLLGLGQDNGGRLSMRDSIESKD
eukprot:jgi/Psemu1/240607/estExt_Genewise1.C_1890031